MAWTSRDLGICKPVKALSIDIGEYPQMYASVAMSSVLFEDDSCAIFICNAASGSLAAIFCKRERSIPPGSSVAVVGGVPELLALCPNVVTNGKLGTNPMLSIMTNIETMLIL